MGRVKLSGLLDDVKHTLEPSPSLDSTPPAATAPQPPVGPEADVAPIEHVEVVEGSQPAPSAIVPVRPKRTARRDRSGPAVDHVHYASLVRKEARLRDDQIESLTLRARRLSRNKVGTDPRITDNTLIRIAVDLLLSREAELAGNSEAELRRSVGL